MTIVTKDVQGLATHRSKANKQARLVERKVCFISDAGSWQGGGFMNPEYEFF